MHKLSHILLIIFALNMGKGDKLRAESLGQRQHQTYGLFALPASESDNTKRSQVKAGFVVNFASFTTWPPLAFADEKAPLVITVVNDNEVARHIAAFTDKKTIHGRNVVLYHVVMPATSSTESEHEGFIRQFKRSHVVYFSGAMSSSQIDHIISDLDHAPVLTVGDVSHFADNGGMLGLVERDGRMTFDANVDAIDAAELVVSSKVLRMARIVRNK